MYKLRYRPQAKRDLIAIKRYIAEKSGSSRIAMQFTEKLRQQCLHLSQLSSKMGTHRPELAEGIRSFPYGNYILFIMYNDEFMDVVTILERHRDIGALFHSKSKDV